MNKIYARTALIAVTLMLPITAAANHSEEVGIADVPAVEGCAITRDIGLGSRGADVICLQKSLMDAALLTLSAPTGYFGTRTKAALVHWQERAGLPTTGYFGALSRSKLSGATIIPVAVSHEHSEVVAATTSSAMHAHASIDVTAWPARPAVSIVMHKDAMSGYNLEIIPVNFQFAPEHVNGVVVPNEGHTHLMVNGKKIARVYGPWFHIGQEFLAPGTNDVLVTLNGNDHSELSADGVRIEATSTISM